MGLSKADGNWVDGERFFNRDAELSILEDRVRNGGHTLLAAPRRMGKTSLVRELLRRLRESGEFETIFVDLEFATSPADAVTELGVQARFASNLWSRIREVFSEVGRSVEQVSVADLKVKVRAAVNDAWAEKGDAIFQALCESERPVVVALDELAMLVNEMLNADDAGRQGRSDADRFLRWLRKCGQSGERRVSFILSGSVSLLPILARAGLTAHANIYQPYHLEAWSDETAMSCLASLASNYELDLDPAIGPYVCQRLRSCVPHHVQIMFNLILETAQQTGDRRISLGTVKRIYDRGMLGVRGQADLQHYESRLHLVLGADYTIGLELLTAAATANGKLSNEAVDQYDRHYSALSGSRLPQPAAVAGVLDVLRHDGYLEESESGWTFSSGLLEDWWRGRYGGNFKPAFEQP